MFAAFNLLHVRPAGYRPGYHDKIIVTHHATAEAARTHAAVIEGRGSDLARYVFVGVAEVEKALPQIENSLGEVSLADLERVGFPVPETLRHALKRA